jgi:SAM-dependent methyltransferase
MPFSSSVVFQLLVLFNFFIRHRSCTALSQKKDSAPTISRRDYWKVSIGAAGGIAYGKLVGDTLYRISQGIERPLAHEQRVEAAITLALAESAASFKSDQPFRILEVGIGSDCRLLRRGLYTKGLEQLESRKIPGVEVTGVDLARPSEDTLRKALTALSQHRSEASIQVDLNAISGDLTAGLSFPEGYFDSIICCLTLCSVADQTAALREMKRLIRPTGGTLAYAEHVAVNPEEPYRFLEWQQEFFDPLQQRLADNCHLHRYTDDTIANVFELDSGSGVRLQHERFLVDDMWPVSCQCSGVIQMRA